MAAPWSCAVTPSWGPSKSSWSSNSSSICRRNHHHASPRQQRRFPSHPTPCSGDFRDASVDIAHFFTPVEKVGLGLLALVIATSRIPCVPLPAVAYLTNALQVRSLVPGEEVCRPSDG